MSNIITADINFKFPQELESKVEIAIEQAVVTTLNIVRDRWLREAQNKLNSTRTDYLMGLDFDSIEHPYLGDPFAGAVVLRGKWPNMLEKGFSAFDIKQGFSKSSKKHIKPDGGWYLNVPLRHSTPGSFMYGKPMPVDIYTQAKKLPNRGSISVKGGIKTSWTGYVHKANIHDKLTRIIKDYGKTKQSTYMTWRRASNTSDPDSWWHPGFGGVNISDNLQSYTRNMFVKILKANIKQVIG
jgi:hypothetical protein